MTEELNGGCLDEREAFEAWAAAEWDGKSVPDAAWLGWKARSASRQEGWQLVPVEPTEAMLNALHDAIGHDVQRINWDGYEEVSVLDVHTFPAAYRAMLVAAPQEAQGDRHGE
jgi:hypothetical protein